MGFPLEITSVHDRDPEAPGPRPPAMPAALPCVDMPEAPFREALSTVWVDRDLSWLEFNRRVLAEAMDERTPLLERLKFLAIFTSNLDEFFMKRIAVLMVENTGTHTKLLADLRAVIVAMVRQQQACFDALLPKLEQQG